MVYVPYHSGSFSPEQAASPQRRAAPEALTYTGLAGRDNLTVNLNHYVVGLSVPAARSPRSCAGISSVVSSGAIPTTTSASSGSTRYSGPASATLNEADSSAAGLRCNRGAGDREKLRARALPPR